MENINLILCGLGGQGILFMTKVLAQAALKKDLKVLGAETHGMAQRGGSVISHLKLGSVEGSLVRAGTAHFLISLDENEVYRNIPLLARGGRLYTDAQGKSFPRAEVKQYLDKLEIVARSVPASKIAMEMGSPMSSNLAMLGFFAAFNEGPLNHEEIRDTIDQISPDRFKENNLKAFEAGFSRKTDTMG
ncbi:MAG: indolepyruvate oxidoreductase subunit beta [Deltaproteobacteria bacterium]|nr:indolepyruvate oxidoreductase subunit beta [Deltaproteobacteria bacterium]